MQVLDLEKLVYLNVTRRAKNAVVMFLEHFKCHETLQELSLKTRGTLVSSDFAKLPPNLIKLQIGTSATLDTCLTLNEPMKLDHFHKLQRLEIWGSCDSDQSLLGKFSCLPR